MALDQGYDIDGYYLQGLIDLGYDYVIVGPISYEANWKEQPDKDFPQHFGVKGLKAKLRELSAESTKQAGQQIAVSLIPSEDVVTFTPYLLDVELARSARELASDVDIIVLNLMPQYVTLL